MLFIPWIYREAQRQKGTPAERVAFARDLEFQLSEALLAGGETTGVIGRDARSEEHTSELQSLMRISYAVFCLKKKNKTKTTTKIDDQQHKHYKHSELTANTYQM